MKAEEVWSQTLEQIKNSIPENEYSSWFSRLKLGEQTKEGLVLYVPSAFVRDKFNDKYKEVIEESLSSQGCHCSVLFKISNNAVDNKQTSVKPAEQNVQAQKVKANPTLNPAYTFESFVPGDNSNFAYNACLAIAKNPGTTYNPCLLYGGVGLGKTHLLQSIGNAVVKENSKAKVMYVTAENFTNEFIQSINDKNPRQFQNKYRKVAVLLIDDIQFLQKKESTQNELFNTFNDLYDTGRQIVFTCDRPVEELKDITDRLRSRFERGLNIDIQPPSYETRVAILRAKCKEKNFIVSDEVLEFIAYNISSNVRALESCITKLIAYSTLLNKDISLETAKEQLKQIISSNNDTSGISLSSVVESVAEYFNVSSQDIKGKAKSQSIVLPRQVAMYLCRELTDFSTTEIASFFGGKNHTTVLYNVQKVESLMHSSERDVANTVAKLTNIIKSGSKTRL